MRSARGRLGLALHAHLPWLLGHGTWPHGEEWLFEAASETYLPLLGLLAELASEGRRSLLSLEFSPVLCAQLANPGWQRRFRAWSERRARAAGADRRAFRAASDTGGARLAGYWEEFHQRRLSQMHALDGDILGAFAGLERLGVLELFTCAATHGYLPLLESDASIRTQLVEAVRSHRHHFGRDPRGVWLPECAYRPRGAGADCRARPGIEEFLRDTPLRYFFVDTHLLLGGRARLAGSESFRGPGSKRPAWHFPERAGLDPLRAHCVATQGQPVSACDTVVFTRDERTGKQVWSGDQGYPGDGRYLEFHKRHHPGGHRYWRVTGRHVDLGAKERYAPAEAEAALRDHASHFATLLEERLLGAGPGAMVCALYDAELFGHWWHEGVTWMGQVLRQLARRGVVETATFSEQLEFDPPRVGVDLPEGSWGDGGHHQVWRNERTEWAWRLVHAAERRMATVARACRGAGMEAREAAGCAARQLLLLQASDWTFLIGTGSAADYAAARIQGHAADFEAAAGAALALAGGTRVARRLRDRVRANARRDAVFPDLDWSAWAEDPQPATTPGLAPGPQPIFE